MSAFEKALAEAQARAWDEGVATALNHAILNPDKITLRLEHLDGRPWLNPYRDGDAECAHPKAAREMRGWTQVCTICGLGREIG